MKKCLLLCSMCALSASIPASLLLSIKIIDEGFVRYLSGLSDKSTFNSMEEDNSGNLWLGSGNKNGLYFKGSGDPEFQKFTKGIGEDVSINKIYIDSTQSVWVATVNNGLYCKTSGEDTFKKYNDGLGVNPTIIAIAEDLNGNLWVGENTNGLYVRYSGTKDFLQFQPDVFSTDTITSILPDDIGNMWIGALDPNHPDKNGLYEKADGGKTFSMYKDGLPNDIRVDSIIQTSDKNIWVGGNYVYEKPVTSTTFSQVTKGLPKFPDNFTTVLYQDMEKNIWIGGNNQLFERDFGSDSFHQESRGFPEEGNIYPRFIYQDTTNDLWVGSDKGLYISKNQGFGYSFKEGAKSGIYKDKDAKYWITSNGEITVWFNSKSIDYGTINGRKFENGEYVFDGKNYDAEEGKYTVTITYTNKKEVTYYFWIKDYIKDPDFYVAQGDKIDRYIGYLNGDPGRVVDVVHVWGNGLGKNDLGMHLENDPSVDWSNSYYQEVDPNNYKPIGMATMLSQLNEHINKDGIYKLVVCDLMGNQRVYYVQLGGKDRQISDKVNPSPTPTPVIVNNNLPSWAIILIVIGAIGTLATSSAALWKFVISPKFKKNK